MVTIKKRILIVKAAMTLIFAAVCMSTWADEVTEEQALEQAQQFVSSHNTRKSAPTVKSAGQVSGLYVFNVSNGGFVIVSNDDQTVPILGFGDSGNIDPDDLPDNMRAWLQGYADQIAWLQSNGSVGNDGNDESNRSRAPLRTTKSAIGPLVQTNWNQSRPYYDLCPEIDGEHAVTGCVATTVAQLMYYHYAHNHFSAESTALSGYTTSTKNKKKEAISLDVGGLDATTFEWDKMIANYTPINPETGKRYLAGTTEQQQAVATLMLYCGTALQMMYGLSANGGSSAYSEAIPYALKTCFGYDGGVRHCYRKNYSYMAWMDLIYSELEADRPVALGGQSTGGGHSFICDGYEYRDDADYFHINWGWAGSSDGYFQLSVLQPWEQGIGGSSTLDGFSFGQDAVIGIQKPVEGNADYCLSLEGLRLGGSPDGFSTSKTFTRDNATDDFTGISIYYDVWNYNYGSNAYDVAVQLVDSNGDIVLTFGGQENQTKEWNENISATLTDLSIPSTVGDGTNYITVGDGTYYIKVMSKLHSETAWQECFDGDAYKLTAIISGNELTINVPIPANVIPASVTFAVSDEFYAGVEQTVTATVTGGTGGYSGDIVLRVNGTAVMGQIAHIPANESVPLTFSYIPSDLGNNELTLWTHRSGGSRIGDPETVTISTLVIDDNGSNNTSLIEKNDKLTGNVKLAGRTLYKDGKWNTLCLPFSLTAEQITASPLAGATIMTLDVTSKEENSTIYKTRFDSDGTLYLNFTTVTAITAGTPYIIKWGNGDNITEPVFNGITLSKDFNDLKSGDGKVQFLGRYSARKYTKKEESTLLLGGNNTLYYPQPDLTDTEDPKYPIVGACRAFFEISNAPAVRAFSLIFGDGSSETGIESLSADSKDWKDGADAWYSLDGVRLSGKPTQRGIYINNGRKVIY